MKRIKVIEDLLVRAEKRGVAIKNGRQRDFFGRLGNLEEVYRVENDGRLVSLYHYGTLTVRVDLKLLTLVDIYGESRSDVDSINTFLSWLGFEGFCFGFKPVNGGFYLLTFKDGKRQETFLDKDGEENVLKAFNGVDFDFQGFFKSLGR